MLVVDIFPWWVILGSGDLLDAIHTRGTSQEVVKVLSIAFHVDTLRVYTRGS